MKTILVVILFSLIIAGFLGGIFFGRYKGESIQSPVIWQIVSIAISVLAILALQFGARKETKEIIDDYSEELKKFKAKAEIIVPDFDACEFKNGTYSQEVEDKEYSWMAGNVMFKHEITKVEQFIRSGLLYHQKTGSSIKKYASHSFPFDKTALQFYVINGKIKLYVDRFDRSKYFFELDESK